MARVAEGVGPQDAPGLAVVSRVVKFASEGNRFLVGKGSRYGNARDRHAPPPVGAQVPVGAAGPGQAAQSVSTMW